jgi:hypothetical protein
MSRIVKQIEEVMKEKERLVAAAKEDLRVLCE